MGRFILATLFACALLAAPSSGSEGGPTYQRTRQQVGGFHGSGFRNPGYGGWGYGGWGYGGFYNPPIIVGSYYQRPYPTHLDFFRLRQRAPLVVPYPDCPTYEGPVIVSPAE